MKYLFMVVLIGGIGALIFQAAPPSPRLTIGDAGRDQWTPAQFSPDGKTILARGYRTDSNLGPPYDDVLKLWDVATGKETRVYRFSGEKRTQRINEVGFSPDGKHVLACGQDLPLVMWETDSAKEVLVLGGKNIFAPETETSTNQFAFSSDGSQILTTPGRRLLRSWDSKSGKMLKDLDLAKSHAGATVSAIHFSKDGKYFVLESATQISIWDFAKMQMIFLGVDEKGGLPKVDFWLPLKVATMGYVLAPDGQGILVTTPDGKITELDLATTKEKRSFELKTDKIIHALALSPKGDRILTTGMNRDYRWEGVARLYSFPECKELKRMPGYGRVQFSPDGKTALTFTKNGRMMLWDLGK